MRQSVLVICTAVLTTTVLLTTTYMVPFITWSRPVSRPFERSAIISFSSDDGRSSDLNSANVMREYGYRMTFYVTSSMVGRTMYMDYGQLLKLQSEGFEVGSHGVTHADLTALSFADATKEIVDSKAVLESHGLRVNCFAFSYGLHNRTLDAIANRTYTYVRYDYCGLTGAAYSIIDEAIADKTLVNFNFHGLDAWGNVLLNGRPIGLKLSAVLDYLNRCSVPVLTQIQAHYLDETMNIYDNRSR